MPSQKDILLNVTTLEWFQVFMGTVTNEFIYEVTRRYTNAALAWDAIEALAND